MLKNKIDAGSQFNTWGLNEIFRSQPVFLMTRITMWENSDVKLTSSRF